MSQSESKDNNKLIVINLLVLTIILYLLRATIPFLKFPFIILFFGIILYSIITKRTIILQSTRGFFGVFFLPIILFLMLIISFLISSKLFLVIFKDIFNAIVLLTLFFLMTLFLTSKNDFKFFYRSFIYAIIVFALGVSLILLGNYFNLSLSTDYNFVLLPVFFGLIATLYVLSNQNSPYKYGIYNAILLIFTITIFVSGSRRGIITLIGLIIILVVVQFYTFIGKHSNLRKIARGSVWFLLTFLLLTVFSYVFVFRSSYYFKKNVIELINPENGNATRYKIATAVFRYISTIKKDINYFDLYDRIWINDFDKALDPDSGWGTNTHKTVFPLTGKNSEILPPEARGYMLDSTCNASSFWNKAYSHTVIGNPEVRMGDIIIASVYCYISEDFNGDLVQFYSEGSAYGSRVSEDSHVNSINKTTFRGNNPIRDTVKADNLFFNGNFEDSTLYWIPNADSTTHEIIETPFGKGIRVSRTDGNGGWWSLRYEGPSLIYNAGHRYEIKFQFKVQKGSELPFNIGWWVAEQHYSASRLPLSIKNIGYGWKEATGSFKFEGTYYNLPVFLNSLQDHSVVDIANVQMKDLDHNDSIPSFVDQLGVINMEKRGEWRKLILKTKCNDGYAPIVLSFSKDGKNDFSSLKGYIIFAYPKYEIISKNDTALTSRSTVPSSIQHPSMAGMFPYGFISNFFLQRKIDNDPVRNLAAKLVSEDTTYYGLKEELVLDTISNKFISDRLVRWQFASQIFFKEYDWKQKILGKGFNFLNWFGYYFQHNKTINDYPHNPFLSILLYSGVLGLIIYLIFLYRVFIYYLRSLKEYPVLFMFFMITFFFSFFSAGSPFDPPIMGFFMLLPFLMNYVNKNSLTR